MAWLTNYYLTFIFCFVMCFLNLDADFIARKPLRKTWWGKRVSDSLFVAGRLSDEQIKYASEDGFKSIVAVYNHTAPGNFGSQVLVTTQEAKDIAVRLSGLAFEILCGTESHNEDDVKNACWRSKGTIEKFDDLYKRLPKPVLLYSNTGYSATFIALSWLVWQTKLGKVLDTVYQTSAEHFYRRASGLGYDFTGQEDLRNIVEDLGGKKVNCPAKPDVTIPDWHKRFWWAKPVEKNWYIAGQIRSNQFDLIRKLDPGVVINSRRGSTYTNPDTGATTETQEEVTLLNVNENCSTYKCSGGRQSEAQLLANRIDPNKPASYISPSSPAGVNYMSRNPLEFGDDIGYNETIERLAIRKVPMEYIHTPIGGHLGYHETMYRLYNGTWREAHAKGNIFAHCRTGYRAIVPTLLTLGMILEKDMDWAIEKGRLVGYSFSERTDAAVWNLFKFAFNNSKLAGRMEDQLSQSTCSDDADNGAVVGSRYLSVWLLLIAFATFIHNLK